MTNLEKLKAELELRRDEALRYAQLAKRDREQYSYYFGRQMAFIECVNEINAIILNNIAESIEEVDHEKN